MVFGVSWAHHFFFRPYELDVSSMISGFLGIVQFSVSRVSSATNPYDSLARVFYAFGLELSIRQRLLKIFEMFFGVVSC